MLTRTDLEDLIVLVTNNRYLVDTQKIERNHYTSEEYADLSEEKQLVLRKYDRLLTHLDKELDKLLTN